MSSATLRPSGEASWCMLYRAHKRNGCMYFVQTVSGLFSSKYKSYTSDSDVAVLLPLSRRGGGSATEIFRMNRRSCERIPSQPVPFEGTFLRLEWRCNCTSVCGCLRVGDPDDGCRPRSLSGTTLLPRDTEIQRVVDQAAVSAAYRTSIPQLVRPVRIAKTPAAVRRLRRAVRFPPRVSQSVASALPLSC
jgi:hypothetical protein